MLLVLIWSFSGKSHSWEWKIAFHISITYLTWQIQEWALWRTTGEKGVEAFTSYQKHLLVIVRFDPKKTTQEDEFCDMWMRNMNFQWIQKFHTHSLLQGLCQLLNQSRRHQFSCWWLHLCLCTPLAAFKRVTFVQLTPHFVIIPKCSSFSQSSSKTPNCWEPGVAIRIPNFLLQMAWISAKASE